MLGTHGQVLSWLTKRKTLAFVVQNCEKPAVKHSIEKPVTPVTKFRGFVYNTLSKVEVR